MKVIAALAGGSVAIISLLLAAHIIFDGRVFLPGRIWIRGYFGGVAGYTMAVAWLSLGVAAVLASCMYLDPRRYFDHRHRRDIALVVFGALFVFAVLGAIVQRANVGAL